MSSAALDQAPVVLDGEPCARVRWSGPLDTDTVPRFQERVDPLLKEPYPSLVLDLEQVEYIDSAGLRYLLSLRDRHAGQPERIVLVVGSESKVERTLRLVGFDTLFELIRSLGRRAGHPRSGSR